LKPRAVSRDLDWGIPVPVKGAEGKVLYVWFDAPIGYISNTRELYPDDWEKWWKDKDTELIHFIGKDNIVFHCIVFPSMLKAHGDYILPENVPANEFLNLEGNKISTSRNWAVWLDEYLVDFPQKQDVLRYVLCANAPETKDNDFTWKDFQTRNNSELVAIYGNFVNRALVLTRKYFDGKVPSADNLTDTDRNILLQIGSLRSSIENSLYAFRFREALKTAMDMARLGNKYLADSEPWKLAKSDMNRVATILNTALQICANLTIIFDPFIPFSSEKLRKMLDIRKMEWNDLGRTDIMKAGHVLGKTALLFEKIEDDQIEAQIMKLQKAKKDNEAKAAEQALKTSGKNPPKPLKNGCVYGDFEKMDIRTATVKEAVRVPKTDKLLKLTIDTGVDIRTIVSGIAEFYTPEEMTGRQICILANLEPRIIRGISSKGMILMAKDENGRMRFITPQDKVDNGASVC
jgi:methionyl-tRNA synthetase